MPDPTIVDAHEEHAAAIAAIYDAAARGSVATFDLEGHRSGWWIDVVRTLDPGAGRLLLVALDGQGEVIGYAKSGEHKSKLAYRTTCETSIYVADRARGSGVGGALYDELLERLDRSPLRVAVGGVAEPNPASARLHLGRGFRTVGTFHGVGTKHGAARDVTWYERPLARPQVVAELEGADDLDAAVELLRRAFDGARVTIEPARAAQHPAVEHRRPLRGDRGLAAPVIDAARREVVALVQLDGRPFSLGDELLLEWCTEALAGRAFE